MWQKLKSLIKQFSGFELLVGLRYTRAKRKNHFISFISLTSMLGIALGVAALIVVLSVMNGFQKEVRDRMLSVLSHIEVIATGPPMLDWQSVLEQSKRNPLVVGGAPYVAGQAMLTRDDSVRGVLVRGIDPALEPRVSELAAQVIRGKLDALAPGEFGVAIGGVLAQQIRVDLGDRIALIAPQGTVTPAGVVPRVRQFTVVAIFQSGHYEYDSTLVLTALDKGMAGREAAIRALDCFTPVEHAIAMALVNGQSIEDIARERRTSVLTIRWHLRNMSDKTGQSGSKGLMRMLTLLLPC
jgi:lipoprotein-releasing system permease protein